MFTMLYFVLKELKSAVMCGKTLEKALILLGRPWTTDCDEVVARKMSKTRFSHDNISLALWGVPKNIWLQSQAQRRLIEGM